MIQSQHDVFVNANSSTGQDKIVVTNGEVQIERKDGSKVWGSLLLSKVRLDNRILYTAFVKDITVEKTAQDIINQRLEQALDVVFTIDKHNITFFNKAAEYLWGYRRKVVIGQNVKMLVPVDIQHNHDAYANANRSNGDDKIVGTTRQVPIHRKDGSTLKGLLALCKIRIGDDIAVFENCLARTKSNRNKFMFFIAKHFYVCFVCLSCNFVLKSNEPLIRFLIGNTCDLIHRLHPTKKRLIKTLN
ncbi:PAS domain S-box protein [Marinomonas fungiae]|nr:PAS domain S-box protein [Marinomonas fungiae]